MTDRDALLKAVSLLRGIASVAGGFVSRSQREELARLEEYTKPYVEQALLEAGWTMLPNGSAVLKRTYAP